jgi:hypothetical protein
MAAQLVPGLIQGLQEQMRTDAVVRLCCLWDALASHWHVRSYTSECALMHLQPDILHLIAYVAMQPMPPPAADTLQGRMLHQATFASLYSTTSVSGAVMDWSWYADEQRSGASGSTRISPGGSSAHRGLRQATLGRPSPEQTAAVLKHWVRAMLCLLCACVFPD